MDDLEIIGRQAKTIMELSDRIAELEERQRNARLHIVCIGGPLNDNKLGYTKEQLVTFQRILGELEE